MLRNILIGVALIAVIAVGAVWYVSRTISLPPVSEAMLAAENALALPDVVAFAHFDLGHAIRAERILLGEEDRQALRAPLAEADIVNALLEAGVDLRRAVQHAVVAVVLTDGEPGIVGVVTGDIPVESVNRELARLYQVAPATEGDVQLRLITREDPGTCAVLAPMGVHATNERIVVGAPALVALVVQRLDLQTPAEIPLEEWRAFREGKVLSAALLGPPGALAEATSNPIAQMAAGAASEELSQVSKAFAGVAIEALPPRLVFDMRIASQDPDWAPTTTQAYATWKAQLARNTGRDLPALGQLTEYLQVEVQDRDLVAQAVFDSDFLRDVAQLPGELMRLAFGGFGATPTDTAGLQEHPEQVLSPDEVTTFTRQVSIHDLPGFDPDLDQSFTAQTETGPFGVRIAGFRLTEAEPGVIEIAIETSSGNIPNIDGDPMHKDEGQARGQLYVTRIVTAR